MAISGGALVPLFMGWLRDLELGAVSFAVPTASFAYLFLLSLKGGRKPAATLPQQSPGAAQA
jgi:fucose permease